MIKMRWLVTEGDPRVHIFLNDDDGNEKGKIILTRDRLCTMLVAIDQHNPPKDTPQVHHFLDDEPQQEGAPRDDK
jgi:hypothetical protein